MKVLQVNTVTGYGSTGRTCVELSDGLIANGHEAFIAYSQGSSAFPNSFRFGNTVEQKAHALLSRITGLQGYYSPVGTRELVNWINCEKPDIVHLHNLHSNNINLIQLLDYLADSNTAVVITLHDCWFFTGKCTHYTNDNCIKWETHCHKCPRLRKDNKSLFFDRTPKMFEEKKRAFGKLNNLAIIGVSDWINNEAKRSFLKNAKILETIYNWIDQSVFRPTNGNLRKKYGIPEEKSIVLGVSAGWSNKGKKLKDFTKLAGLMPENVKVVLVGGKSKLDCIPDNIIHIPYINSATEMAEVYSLADVYVHLSTEDTFGKVIAEAMACGTPVVVYNSTACPEVVGRGCGIIVDRRDIVGITRAAVKIITDGKSVYSGNCIKHVTENFNYNQQVRKTVRVYERILQ